jgi:hypothetical protein
MTSKFLRILKSRLRHGRAASLHGRLKAYFDRRRPDRSKGSARMGLTGDWPEDLSAHRQRGPGCPLPCNARIHGKPAKILSPRLTLDLLSSMSRAGTEGRAPPLVPFDENSPVSPVISSTRNRDKKWKIESTIYHTMIRGAQGVGHVLVSPLLMISPKARATTSALIRASRMSDYKLDGGFFLL